MKQKMVSIIIPVYNAEKYLTECITSIMNQTYKNIELIMVDDGSTDESLNILKKYEMEDDRIKVLSKPNGGSSSARNLGMKYVHGEFVTFVDSDDFLERDSIECLLNKILEFNCDRVCGGSSYYYSSNKIVQRKFRIKDGLYSNKRLLDYSIDDGTLSGFLFGGVANCLFKTKIIMDNNLQFDEQIRLNEDGLFHFQYALSSTNTYVYKEHTKYMYRQHLESVSHKIITRNDFSLLHKRLNEVCRKEGCDVKKQMSRRYITESFWIINSITLNHSFIDSYRKVRTILSEERISTLYQECNMHKMAKSKKIIVILMRLKWSCILVALLKYVVPILR